MDVPEVITSLSSSPHTLCEFPEELQAEALGPPTPAIQRAGQSSQKAVFQYVLTACYSPREAEETGPDLGQQERLVLIFCCFVLFLVSAEQPTGAKKPHPVSVPVTGRQTERSEL